MLWLSRQMILVRKSSYRSLQLTSCEEYLIIWNIHCIHRKAEENSGASEEVMIWVMFSWTHWCHGWNSPSQAVGSLCLALPSVLLFLAQFMNQRVSLMSFVRQSRKGTLYFIEFWIIFFFGPKSLNMNISRPTHMTWLQMFLSLNWVFAFYL